MKACKYISLSLLALFCASGIASADTLWLDELNLKDAIQGWGDPHKNRSVGGNALTIGGTKFARGFGTHSEGLLRIQLNSGGLKFTAMVGVDDEVNHSKASSVEFFVIGDGKTLWKSGIMHADDPPKLCEADLTGINMLLLKAGDGGDGDGYDHADWADARIEVATGTKVATVPEAKPAPVAPYILTPAAPATPRINGASVFGVRPGSPFLFHIPATGDRPMTFKAKNLPSGLMLDEKTGIITGALKEKGEFKVTLQAINSHGKTKKEFRIVCGDQIALTPPMGWNSWNCFAGAVSADRVKRAADALVKSGLINHGWTYINIDDFWENKRDSKDPTLQGKFRDEQGNIVPNSRFPDMKGLADYVHGLGLKIGLYSSPGPWTCGGCTGSWQHEQQDARTYAQWGFDYLKYDWCSYGSVASGELTNSTGIPRWGKGSKDDSGAVYPYAIMGKYLREQNRDIVFSLCQYGMADVWKWGGSVNGNCWRTTGDIVDTWRSLSNIGFNQDKAAPHARPGNWNDPDMLIVGQVGWGNLHPTRLTTDEQYTHISLWCLLSAPLLIGCDMEKFDDFTLNLLSNDEVLAVDQDPLGREAQSRIKQGNLLVYEKELEDGGHAVGFFNLDAHPAKMDFKDFAALGITGTQHVRDLWRQKDLADVNVAKGSISIEIPGHGVVLYKLRRAK